MDPFDHIQPLESRRLLALDPSFGTDGIAMIDFGAGVNFTPVDVSVGFDASIVAVGEASLLTPAAPSPLILRLNPDGTPDERFAPGGILLDTPGGMSRATSVEAVRGASEGSLLFYVAGVREGQGSDPDRVVLSRYTRLGKHDRSFDVRGRGSVLLPQLTSVGDIHVLPDGSVLLAGTAQNRDVAVLKLASNGRVDTSFGENGLTPTITEFTSTTRSAGALAVDSVGRILLGVTASDPAAGDEVFVRRFIAVGARDTSFGTGGTANVPELLDAQQIPDETLRGLVVDPSNRPHVYYGREDGTDLRGARLLENGQLDTGFFGTGGVAEMPDHFTADLFTDGPARGAVISGVELFDGARTANRFVGGATDRNGPLVPGVVGVSSDGSVGGFGFFGVAEMEGAEGSDAILAPAPGGMLVSVAVPTDPKGSQLLSFARFFADNRPTAVLNVKPVRPDGDPAQFWVTYRSETGIDLDSIDTADLHITLPGGSVRSAHVRKVEPNADNTAVTVRYSIPAPGGLWESADNGDYIIRLRSREDGVRTPAGDIFAIGQVLGMMTVDF